MPPGEPSNPQEKEILQRRGLSSAGPKRAKSEIFQSLGATRDYLTVQMAQDASWNDYRPENR